MPTAWRERRGSKFRVRYRDAKGIKRTAKTCTNAMDADEEVARIEGAQIGQPTYPGELMPLGKCVRAYVRARVADGSMGEGNAYTCERTVNLHAKAQKWETVADVTPAALRAWRTKDNPRTGPWRHLRAVLRWAALELDQPVDARLLVRVPSPRRAPGDEPELIPDALVKQALARAREYPSAYVLLHWLATYGPRPVTLFHLVVGDVDLRQGIVSIRHNKNGKAFEHPLLPRTVRLLRPLMKGRARDERLFLDPRTEEPWEFSKVDSANRLSEWYRKWIATDFPAEFRGPYILKDWAISQMARNGIGDDDIIRFSGHKNTQVLARYRKTNVTEARKQLARLPAVG